MEATVSVVESRLLDALNDRQAEAVSSQARNLLVLAGAGSGKTRVLTRRVAWLISEVHVPPRDILAVTFTNKAANEMKERVARLVGTTAWQIWIGTFHHTGWRILQQWQAGFAGSRKLHVLDADDRKAIVRRLRKQLNIDPQQYSVKSLVGYIGRRKLHGIRSSVSGSSQAEPRERVYHAYEQYCLQVGGLDFDELLLRPVEMFRDSEEFRRQWEGRFKYVLVDEFQDTNGVQYDLMSHLVGDDGSLFAVGDDDQAIYGWREADVGYMLDLDKRRKGLQVVKLEQNYRSAPNILAAANGVIAVNEHRLTKNLWTQNRDDGLIRFHQCSTEVEQATDIARVVSMFASNGGKFGDVAVLYRVSGTSNAIEHALRAARVPFIVAGGFSFYGREEVKDALAYLRLASDHGDDQAFERIVNKPRRHIGTVAMEKLRTAALGCASHSLWEAASSIATTDRHIAADLLPMLQAVTRAADMLDGVSLEWVMRTLVTGTGLLAYHAGSGGEAALQKESNLAEVVRDAASFDTGDYRTARDAASAFLSHAALESERKTGDSGDAVTLTTIHRAKGLEWPVVIIAGFDEGIMPHAHSVQEGNEDEERRLVYVAITRAKQGLYFVSSGCPSPYLRDLPQYLLSA